MFGPSHLRFEPRVLVDYTSPHGARVTDTRGMLLQSRLQKLREHGHFEEYFARLPEPYRDPLVNALASSWVPIDVSVAHFETLDGMGLNEAQIARMSEPMGAGFLESLFSGIIRAARNAGADAGAWVGLKQADRVFARMYQGGTCRVTQVGPKDAVIDVGGLAFASSRSFRISHCAFLRGAIHFATKTCLCKPQMQRDMRKDQFTVALSWV